MTKYDSLPAAPKEVSAAAILERMFDGVGFRYKLATSELDDSILTFCPVEGSMNMNELLIHIYMLLKWMGKSVGLEFQSMRLEGMDQIRDETLKLCGGLSDYIGSLDDAQVAQIQIHLPRAKADLSFWYLINGPIADALTHIGQINSWRRIAGHPVPKVSPLTGEPF